MSGDLGDPAVLTWFNGSYCYISDNIRLCLDIGNRLWYGIVKIERSNPMQKKLLTNGNAFKRTDGRWCGVVWYMDEEGERKRKSFSGTTKQEVNKKMTDYVAAFHEATVASQESKKRLRDSMQNWL